MGRFWTSLGLLAVLVFLRGNAWAHFGMILPSDDIVEQGEARKVELRLMFLHPFEQKWMDWGKPKAIGVFLRGEKAEELTRRMEPVRIEGRQAWKVGYELKRPGDYVFYLEPEPYWEPSEGKFIAHYPKVVVNAFGLEEGWDTAVGLPVEIVPLVRPYGLWTGNCFRGLVLVDGKPAPGIEVEVEYFNEGQGVKAPAEPFVTQVIKADPQGIFCYSMPRAGWWGFAALADAPYKLKRDGKEYPVELGGVFWVRVEDMR